MDGIPDSTVDLIIRSGLNFPVSREAKWRPLSERTVAALTEALNLSSLVNAMASLALAGAFNGDSDPFSPRGLNRSRTVTLTWWCAPSGWPQDTPKPMEASVRLEVPGSYGDVNQNLRVETDVVVRKSAWGETIRQQSPEGSQIDLPAGRITVQEVGQLIDAMVATLSGKDFVQPLADLGGIDPIAVPQPRIMHMVTARPVTEVLDLTGLRPIPEAGVSMGAHLLADPRT